MFRTNASVDVKYMLVDVQELTPQGASIALPQAHPD